ncbi:hypothetical protein [Pontibacter sp. G13]|uniref:hypothetical protein n=1 Tax=Pontibacter sp. G13 TaxID=3074898 RepID=UPI00288A30D6|nr:hypothetical protein [Pontibacter sp. G13]WNJ20597.1 hypothetical protein RJD25_08945 [Pontibacter sp. G13]
MRHYYLMAVNVEDLGEFGDPTLEPLQTLAETFTPEIIPQDLLLTIRTWRVVNECGNYVGNIQMRGDTVVLIYPQLEGELCDGLRIQEVRYLMQRPKEWGGEAVVK